MKRKLSILLGMLCLSTIAFSQAQFALGIKAGPNFAKLDEDASAGENYKSRTGFHGGAFALIKLTKIGIQPEIIFSQQGSTVKFNNQDLDANYSYINIPIMLKVYLVAGLNLQVGPQFGFVANAKREFVDDLGNVTKEDIKDEMKKSDISAGLGAGWDLPFGLTVDARYNLGLSKLYDHADAPEAKNQVFQLSLGYKLIKFGN